MHYQRAASYLQALAETGGVQTLASYGCVRKKVTPDRARQLVDPRPFRFLAALPLLHVVGDIYSSMPASSRRTLQRQDAGTLMTIRRRFLKQPHGLPFTVVHGHTPTDGRPESRAWADRRRHRGVFHRHTHRSRDRANQGQPKVPQRSNFRRRGAQSIRGLLIERCFGRLAF